MKVNSDRLLRFRCLQPMPRLSVAMKRPDRPVHGACCSSESPRSHHLARVGDHRWASRVHRLYSQLFLHPLRLGFGLGGEIEDEFLEDKALARRIAPQSQIRFRDQADGTCKFSL